MRHRKCHSIENCFCEIGNSRCSLLLSSFAYVRTETEVHTTLSSNIIKGIQFLNQQKRIRLAVSFSTNNLFWHKPHSASTWVAEVTTSETSDWPRRRYWNFRILSTYSTKYRCTSLFISIIYSGNATLLWAQKSCYCKWSSLQSKKSSHINAQPL